MTLVEGTSLGYEIVVPLGAGGSERLRCFAGESVPTLFLTLRFYSESGDHVDGKSARHSNRC